MVIWSLINSTYLRIILFISLGMASGQAKNRKLGFFFFARLLQSEIFFGIISNFIYKVFLRTWQRAKPRTLTGQLFILGTLWICFCSLFYVFGTYGQVFAHDLNYWNFIIKVEYSYMEIYLTSLIWFNCMFTGFSSQRITPMIQFCSSVISMVAPSWCHGPS